jgi:stage V sporulation protein G
MRLTDIRIKLCESHNPNNRLRAFCALTFDNTFVIRDVKLIEGNDGLFLAMPSRKLADHCPRCGEKNHLRARFCNHCGTHLDEGRFQRYQNGNVNGGHNGAPGHNRLKLHADIAHPINAECRQAIEREVVDAFNGEVEKSKQPGYVPPSLDGEDMDFFELGPSSASRMRLRPTGTTAR